MKIFVFYKKQPTYNPQYTYSTPYKRWNTKKAVDKQSNYGKHKENVAESKDGRRLPTTILKFNRIERPAHPTQKPVDLCEWLIKSYSNEGDTILDHTMGVGASVAGVAHGATVIEKHFTLCREDGGVDAAFSLEPEEMKQLVVETKRAWQSLGKVTYGPSEAEKGSLIFRRSLYIAEDIKKNEVLTKNNLRIVRPGLGLPPKYYDILLGRIVKKDVKKGTAVVWEIVK